MPLDLAGARQEFGRLATRQVLVAGTNGISHLPLEEAPPEDAPRDAPRNHSLDGIAVRGSEGRKPAERRRKQLVDLAADHLGQHRSRPFGSDGNSHGRPVHERRRKEIALVRLVDGVHRDAHFACKSDDGAIARGVAGGGEHEDCGLQHVRRYRRSDDFDTVVAEVTGEIRSQVFCDDHHLRIGVAEQPDLGISLLAAPHDDNPPSADAKEGGEHRKLVAGVLHLRVRFEGAALSPIRDRN